MPNSRSASPWFAIGVFSAALVLGPLWQMQFLAVMPGDIGDARLNNYFLENIYLFLTGKSPSLWQLSFYAPFPYVLGFSDNLFGAAPIYVLARWITGETDTAFQVWFLVGYGANYAAAHYALRRLGLGGAGACLGALIFAFALPTTAHAGHAQLHYRFGIPLATLYFIQFLEDKRLQSLSAAALWLTWQFYCGVYMGFFALLLLLCVAVAFVAVAGWSDRAGLVRFPGDILRGWLDSSVYSRSWAIGALVLSLAAMALLLFPYLKVSLLYGSKREWAEIEPMLPRWRSYLMSDASMIWGGLSRSLRDVPMRPEHQMFAGLLPWLLALAGLAGLGRSARHRSHVVIAGSLFLMIALASILAGYSLWYLFHRLPLASAIRAMTRIDQVLLFPLAVLAGLAVDKIKAWLPRAGMLVVCVLVALIVAEGASTKMYGSPKATWRERLSGINRVVGTEQPSSIIFVAQQSGPVFAHEIDVMWAALQRGSQTMNGYSGLAPPGYAYEYGTDCTEVVRRVLSYLHFSRQNDDAAAYRALMSRLKLIGFEGCNPAWWETMPAMSIAARPHTREEIARLRYRVAGLDRSPGRTVVSLILSNSGPTSISARSGQGTPIRLSWRFLNREGQPLSGWDTRKDIPFDIPAAGELPVTLSVEANEAAKGGSLQISLVQEGLFWAHDAGLAPLTLPWE